MNTLFKVNLTLSQYEFSRNIMWLFATPLMLKMYCDINSIKLRDINIHCHVIPVVINVFNYPYENTTIYYYFKGFSWVLILFFMKISYEYSQIDISYLLKIFINEVPFFKQFSHVLFETNGSYTTFFYNILASANTVSLYLPPIFNELLINQISFSIILKNLAFAFTLIVNIILLGSNGVLPSIKKLMEMFQEILCNDDSKIITDTFEFNKKQLIEESTKLINNTNVIQAIEDMKPKKTRTFNRMETI